MDFDRELNAEQRLAATTTEGAVRLAAGPGTGKTMTLTARYCYLVSELGVNPANILCATFTNKAANEMKKRIRENLGDLDLAHISTIHAFCLKLLKEDIHVLGYPKNFGVADADDQKELLVKIFADMGLTMRDMTIKQALDEVLEAKKMTADGYIEHVHLLDNESLREKFLREADVREGIFLRYLYEQKKSFLVDFNDLINFAGYILRTNEAVREKWQGRLQYVMLDEFQDVSKRQYDLAVLLSDHHRNLFIVGDPDQTIYSWRGSHVALFNNFTSRHGGASLSLPQNYRSAPPIVEAAWTLIDHNDDRLPYRQRTLREGTEKPLFFRAKNSREEALWIRDKILELGRRGRDLDQMAVIYRAHHLSREVEEVLIEGGVPYTLFSGVAFYNRAEIKDMLSYLRMLTIADDASFLRTIKAPRRGLGKKRIRLLSEQAERRGLTLYQTLGRCYDEPDMAGTGAGGYIKAVRSMREQVGKMPLGDLFQTLMDRSGYEAHLRQQGDQERLDNASEFKRSLNAFAEDPEATVEDFLDRAALFANIDREDALKTVKLMTIHSSKGLEFEAVFIRGLSEGLLPSRQALTPEDLAEERRLCYVAMTRAKDLLFMTDSAGQDIGGLFKHVSRFVPEMGEDNVVMTGLKDGSGRREKARREPAPAPRFKPGQRVAHPVFGPGTVEEVVMRQASYLIKFDRLETTRNLSFSANLSGVV
ncbi:MAG: ATP-dependent helicase [Deltaproteobacteria bacterium]|jgi:DNA helicase-2/ATP-dependent DNA helicase PcrA|nr:ATP-dependent helicase [Deltaproteobacteria bacterium]